MSEREREGKTMTRRYCEGIDWSGTLMDVGDAVTRMVRERRSSASQKRAQREGVGAVVA